MQAELIGWHATPETNAHSIRKQGLSPRWEWSTTHQGSLCIPVHVSIGHAFAGFIADLHNSPVVAVFKVNLDHMVLHPGTDGPGTFDIYEWVKPEWLEFDHYHTEDLSGRPR